VNKAEEASAMASQSRKKPHGIELSMALDAGRYREHRRVGSRRGALCGVANRNGVILSIEREISMKSWPQWRHRAVPHRGIKAEAKWRRFFGASMLNARRTRWPIKARRQLAVETGAY
jgi:hypothetical protein